MRDYREWIEFGKMFETLADHCSAISIYEDCESSCIVVATGEDVDDDELYVENDNIIDAMKDVYFQVMNPDAVMEQLELELDQETISKINELADEDGIPFDEMVTNILKSYLDFKYDYEQDCDCDRCEHDCCEPDDSEEREHLIKQITELQLEHLHTVPTDEMKLGLKAIKNVMGKK
jgi:hypothetical protein